MPNPHLFSQSHFSISHFPPLIFSTSLTFPISHISRLSHILFSRNSHLFPYFIITRHNQNSRLDASVACNRLQHAAAVVPNGSTNQIMPTNPAYMKSTWPITATSRLGVKLRWSLRLGTPVPLTLSHAISPEPVADVSGKIPGKKAIC